MAGDWPEARDGEATSGAHAIDAEIAFDRSHWSSGPEEVLFQRSQGQPIASIEAMVDSGSSGSDRHEGDEDQADLRQQEDRRKEAP